jgi:hypothetical protein
VRDDFEAPDGTPLDGRVPTWKWGTHAWKVGQGEWTLEKGAAVLKKAPGYVRLDCGHNDVEITAKIELPPVAPSSGDWFGAIHARASGPGNIVNVGGINARMLWQKGSNEIEVWGPTACHAGESEAVGRARRQSPDGADQRDEHHAPAAAGADSRSAHRRPREPRELLLRRPAGRHGQHAGLARNLGGIEHRRPGATRRSGSSTSRCACSATR